MNKSIVLILLLATCLSNYIDNRKITLPNDTYDMSYSSDQKYLYIITQGDNFNGLHYYNGFTGKSIGSIGYPNDYSPETLTISQDNRYISVGSKTGGVRIYSQQSNDINL